VNACRARVGPGSGRARARALLFGAGLVASLVATPVAWAASDRVAPVAGAWWLTLALATLAPLLALLVTAFVRVSVVLSFVRQALGGATVPASLISALSVLLTLFIMAPTWEETARLAGLPPGLAGLAAIDARALEKAEEPVRAFLARHAEPREVASFRDLAQRLRRDAPTLSAPRAEAAAPEDFTVLVPAFVASELKRAFEMGLLLLLPFLVVDLIVANLLAVAGLQGLSPATVAVPLKLLLFLLADGWHLLLRGLVEGFVTR